MKRSPRIKPYQSRKLRSLDGRGYDSVLASVGYERRSRQIGQSLGIGGLALSFDNHHEIDYAPNLDFFKKEGWQVGEISDTDFFAAVGQWLDQHASANSDHPARLAADVSSMSRRRIADLVEAVFALPDHINLDFDFLYTPAEYADPDPDSEAQVISVAPVSDAFAAWWDDLEKPLHAIVGLGYEPERAASALDVLEPGSAQIYVPDGNDARYLEAVTAANSDLDQFPGVLPEWIHYSVSDPFSCFQGLEAAIDRRARDHRIALIPLGPKIFALLVTVAAALHPTDAQVIRVSAGVRESAHQRLSDGTVCGLSVALRPPPEPAEQGFAA